MKSSFRKRHGLLFWGLIIALFAQLAESQAKANPSASAIKLEPVDKEPAAGRVAPDAAALKALSKAVADKPKDRAARFAHVNGLIRAGKLQAALEATKVWRKRDAYNLVVVRLLGDIYTELKQLDNARRAYSAVVELLPQDAGAQRALATVLKQSGQLEPAYRRLLAATKLRPEDMRIAFELADTAQRLGRIDEASDRFSTIVKAESTPRKIRYPAKQRLAQILARRRLAALKAKDGKKAKALAAAITALEVKGGAENDIKVYLTWDTDRTDVDLWVVNPSGEKVYYRKKSGRFGGALFDDVTDGYGPESFTAKNAAAGTYEIKVNFYATRRRAFSEARGEVMVILFEGKPKEQRYTLPYRLFSPKQTVTVARLRVAKEGR